MKDRPLPDIPVYKIASKLPDRGKKIGQNMSQCKIIMKATLEVVLFGMRNYLNLIKTQWDDNTYV
jgi:hypothetical protein